MKHLKGIVWVLLLLTVLLPSSICFAQDADPPITDLGALNSGTIAVIVLIIMMVERLLGKILPFIIKPKEESEESVNKAVKMLCSELKLLSVTDQAIHSMIKDLHGWHNVVDPATGRMAWSGAGLARIQETLIAISKNIELQSLALGESLRESVQLRNDNTQAHTALVNALVEISKLLIKATKE